MVQKSRVHKHSRNFRFRGETIREVSWKTDCLCRFLFSPLLDPSVGCYCEAVILDHEKEGNRFNPKGAMSHGRKGASSPLTQEP